MRVGGDGAPSQAAFQEGPLSITRGSKWHVGGTGLATKPQHVWPASHRVWLRGLSRWLLGAGPGDTQVGPGRKKESPAVTPLSQAFTKGLFLQPGLSSTTTGANVF